MILRKLPSIGSIQNSDLSLSRRVRRLEREKVGVVRQHQEEEMRRCRKRIKGLRDRVDLGGTEDSEKQAVKIDAVWSQATRLMLLKCDP